MLKIRKAGGHPTFCWVCNRNLRRAPGRTLGLFHFVLVRDPGGAEHRVHGTCLLDAERDGAKLVQAVVSDGVTR
jgi:hypothetical protein